MAFHIDCKGRHGLISIENKPASYGATPWECNTCKRTIRGDHIGVLNCERCRCDICPDCWTALLPKIVNDSGYPCFWREVQPPHARSTTRLLGCHRRAQCLHKRKSSTVSSVMWHRIPYSSVQHVCEQAAKARSSAGWPIPCRYVVFSVAPCPFFHAS